MYVWSRSYRVGMELHYRKRVQSDICFSNNCSVAEVYNGGFTISERAREIEKIERRETEKIERKETERNPEKERVKEREKNSERKSEREREK